MAQMLSEVLAAYSRPDRQSSNITDRVRVLIVEHDAESAERIRDIVLNDVDADVVGIATSGQAAINDIRDLQPDFVVLDLEIPGTGGFGVVETIGVEKMPVFVLMGGCDRCTVHAFEAHALDYVLKPLEEERLITAVERGKREVAARNRLREAQRLTTFANGFAPHALSRIPIKTGGKIVFFEVEQIDYLEANGRYVHVHVGGQKHITRGPMGIFEEKLRGSAFVRIHRSVIVNQNRIKELKPLTTGEYSLVLNSGEKLTLSRGYRHRLPQLLAARN